jgi:hypothetical protein
MNAQSQSPLSKGERGFHDAAHHLRCDVLIFSCPAKRGRGTIRSERGERRMVEGA